MNKQETIKLLSVLKAAYPSSYKDMGKDDVVAAINLWQSVFADKDYSAASNAVMAFIATDSKGFPPAPGQINAMLQKITTPAGLSEQDAWVLVRKAVSNGRYGSVAEFAKLPPEAKAAVGGAAALKEWAEVPEDELATVVRSNFCRVYRAKAEQEKTWAALPAAVKTFAELAAGDVKQIGGGFSDTGD